MTSRRVNIHGQDGQPVCNGLLADRPHTRLRGLLGRAELLPGEGILIKPASSVHTFWMRYAIDVVFLDAEHRVVRVESGVPPRRIAGARGARSVLELAAGQARQRGLRAGDVLRVERFAHA
jgi:uncharacterized protein